MPDGTIAVIKETDNHRAQPDLDTLGGVTVAQEPTDKKVP
jgi:hypothetical protein